MSDRYKPKMSLSEEMFSSFALRNSNVKSSKNNNIDSDPGTSYEVFRNNTTAIEVIVKEMPKSKKKPSASEYPDVTINRLQEEIDRLKTDLSIANGTLSRSRKGFLAMIREMKKQLDAANQREVDTNTKNLALQLENEKLKCLLNSRTNLLSKLKKELTSMKRVMRYVIKSICYAPQVVTENITCSTDPEYDDFENDLKTNAKVKFAYNMFDEMGTFDSSVSKDTKYSFDKRLF